LWSAGGDVLRDGKVVINSPENARALGFMRDLIYKFKVTPAFVNTMTEEPARLIFGKGNAVFMRNWPYAWNIYEREGSAIKGKVGVAILPHFEGGSSAATLGGWQLGVNERSKHPGEAEKFIRFFTSYEAQKLISMTIGFRPTLKALYKDKELIEAQPFTARLYEVFESARPRPVTPFYVMLSQVLQTEFSSALADVKKPGEALESAEEKIKAILKTKEPEP